MEITCLPSQRIHELSFTMSKPGFHNDAYDEYRDKTIGVIHPTGYEQCAEVSGIRGIMQS